jgi:hypothetical protein
MKAPWAGSWALLVSINVLCVIDNLDQTERKIHPNDLTSSRPSVGYPGVAIICRLVVRVKSARHRTVRCVPNGELP